MFNYRSLNKYIVVCVMAIIGVIALIISCIYVLTGIQKYKNDVQIKENFGEENVITNNKIKNLNINENDIQTSESLNEKQKITKANAKRKILNVVIQSDKGIERQNESTETKSKTLNLDIQSDKSIERQNESTETESETLNVDIQSDKAIERQNESTETESETLNVDIQSEKAIERQNERTETGSEIKTVVIQTKENLYEEDETLIRKGNYLDGVSDVTDNTESSYKEEENKKVEILRLEDFNIFTSQNEGLYKEPICKIREKMRKGKSKIKYHSRERLHDEHRGIKNEIETSNVHDGIKKPVKSLKRKHVSTINKNMKKMKIEDNDQNEVNSYEEYKSTNFDEKIKNVVVNNTQNSIKFYEKNKSNNIKKEISDKINDDDQPNEGSYESKQSKNMRKSNFEKKYHSRERLYDENRKIFIERKELEIVENYILTNKFREIECCFKRKREFNENGQITNIPRSKKYKKIIQLIERRFIEDNIRFYKYLDLLEKNRKRKFFMNFSTSEDSKPFKNFKTNFRNEDNFKVKFNDKENSKNKEHLSMSCGTEEKVESEVSSYITTLKEQKKLCLKAGEYKISDFKEIELLSNNELDESRDKSNKCDILELKTHKTKEKKKLSNITGIQCVIMESDDDVIGVQDFDHKDQDESYLIFKNEMNTSSFKNSTSTPRYKDSSKFLKRTKTKKNINYDFKDEYIDKIKRKEKIVIEAFIKKIGINIYPKIKMKELNKKQKIKLQKKHSLNENKLEAKNFSRRSIIFTSVNDNLDTVEFIKKEGKELKINTNKEKFNEVDIVSGMQRLTILDKSNKCTCTKSKVHETLYLDNEIFEIEGSILKNMLDMHLRVKLNMKGGDLTKKLLKILKTRYNIFLHHMSKDVSFWKMKFNEKHIILIISEYQKQTIDFFNNMKIQNHNFGDFLALPSKIITICQNNIHYSVFFYIVNDEKTCFIKSLKFLHLEERKNLVYCFMKCLYHMYKSNLIFVEIDVNSIIRTRKNDTSIYKLLFYKPYHKLNDLNDDIYYPKYIDMNYLSPEIVSREKIHLNHDIFLITSLVYYVTPNSEKTSNINDDSNTKLSVSLRNKKNWFNKDCECQNSRLCRACIYSEGIKPPVFHESHLSAEFYDCKICLGCITCQIDLMRLFKKYYKDGILKRRIKTIDVEFNHFLNNCKKLHPSRRDIKQVLENKKTQQIFKDFWNREDFPDIEVTNS